MEKEINRTELGKKLKRLRDERGLTIEQVAEALGMKLNTYGTYERKINPKRETLVKIAEFFGVSLDYLLGRKDEPSKDDRLPLNTESAGGSLPLSNYSGYKALEEEIGELTEQEELIVSIFRSADKEDKKKIARYLKKIRDKK